MKKDLTVLGGISIVAIIIGSVLFFYGEGVLSGTSNVNSNVNSPAVLSVITRGTNAPVTSRKNFLISNASDLHKLWVFLYGNASNTPPLPDIDFSREEVVAVFAGEKPTAGYEISVAGIHDTNNKRIVAVTIQTPGASCTVPGFQTSPYEIVTVPTSSLPFTHKDVIKTQPCDGTAS